MEVLRTSIHSRFRFAERSPAEPASAYEFGRSVVLRVRWWLRHPRTRVRLSRTLRVRDSPVRNSTPAV